MVDDPDVGARAAAGAQCSLPPPPPPHARRDEPSSALGRLWYALVGIDIRALAAFRVAMALILLTDLGIRAGSIDAFYTDQGVLTCAQAIAIDSKDLHWSLHALCGAYWYQAALFLIAGFAGCCLLVGYRSRLAALVSWVLLVSLHFRNPQVLQGGDVLIRCLLFWGMMLPLGACWSLDSARVPLEHDQPPKRVATIPALALLLQILFMYWFTSLLKSGDDWHGGKNELTSYTAVFYALSIDQLTTPLGHWLLQFPGLLKGLTRATMLQERFAPFLAFLPALAIAPFSLRHALHAASWGRLLAVLSFCGFHLGLASCMYLGPFPFACWAAWMVFLPSLVWDALAARRARRFGDALRIYFDRDCGFCRTMIGIIRATWLLPPCTVAPSDTDVEIHAQLQRENSWVVVRQDGAHLLRFAALTEVMAHSALLWPCARLLRWSPCARLGDGLYRLVANHRQRLGRWTSWLRPQAYQFEFSTYRQLALDLLAAVLIYYVFLWNLRGTYQRADFDAFASRWFPTWQNGILEVPALDQYWSMFSPVPLRDDGWYLTSARLSDGSTVDVLTGRPPSDGRPADVAGMYPDERWRKYLMNLYNDDFLQYRAGYAAYLARRWNQAHAHEAGHQVVSLDLSFWLKSTRYGAEPALRKVLLAHYPLASVLPSKQPQP